MKSAFSKCLIWATFLPVFAYGQQTVTTTGGSVNSVPKYSGSATIVNSAITENGGNVGIGTNSPAFPLDILVNQNTPTWLSVRNFNTGGNAQAAALFWNGPNAAGAIGVVGSSNTSYPALANWFTLDANSYLSGIQLNTEGAEPIIFSANNTEAMRVSSTGNVGIGTTSPSSKLTVAGTVQSTSGGFQFPDGSVQTTAGIQTPGGSAGYNTGVGASALQSDTTGTYDVATGAYALKSNTSGNYNTATGVNALAYNTTGTYNTALGAYALGSPVSSPGSNNTAVGANSLLTAAGSGNVAVGYGALSGGPALQSSPGNYNLSLGYMAGYNIQNGSYNIDIGNQAQSADSNVIRLGDPNNQTSAYIAGINGVNIASGSTVLINSNGQLGTIQSSARYKEDIHDMAESSDALLQLRPVTFRYKQAQEDGSKPLQFGLVAEEVAKIYPELVVYGKDGQLESVQYHEFPALLLNELQKQHRRLEEQENEIQLLRAELNELRAAVHRTATDSATK